MIFIQPKVKNVEFIKTFIEKDNKKPLADKKKFTIIYWPKRNALCK